MTLGDAFDHSVETLYNGFGLNMRELVWFVKLGMTNEQALQAATVLPAEMLGMEKSLGSIAPGYFADIVAVDGNPLADIQVAVTKVRWVMKGGAVVKTCVLAPSNRDVRNRRISGGWSATGN